jgi:phage gp46-like protein
MNNIPLTLYINNQPAPADQADPRLLRAVLISLFSWRRANPDDDLPSNQRFGWWGDNVAEMPNDKIGSRLWLLSRSVMTAETVARAKEYAEESLAWLIEDGVAATVTVQAERQGLARLAVGCLIVRGDGSTLNLRFADVWGFLNV